MMGLHARLQAGAHHQLQILGADARLTVGAATIGNFDGVHRGHQAVLRQLRRQAGVLGQESCVIGFEPHPREYFAGGRRLARLDTLSDKLDVLAGHGVTRLVLLRFHAALAGMPAQDFARTILFDRLGVRCLVVGDDFRFGRGREGDYALLTALKDTHDCRVCRLEAFCIGGQRVSSTRVREALAANDLALANSLLGRPFCLSGRVDRGDQQGRKLGYPTANIRIAPRLSLVRGVFAARVHGPGVPARPAIAYCGRRRILEAHIFAWRGDLYGQCLRVALLDKLRDDLDFPEPALLRRQLRVDVLRARALLGLEDTGPGPV